jgi:hypothetical protein
MTTPFNSAWCDHGYTRSCPHGCKDLADAIRLYPVGSVVAYRGGGDHSNYDLWDEHFVVVQEPHFNCDGVIVVRGRSDIGEFYFRYGTLLPVWEGCICDTCSKVAARKV